ncbi:hypothetical protein niasHT_004028 [Heterodera trifolii]|uniref:Uncharacterized protein n=1 Tax=Heterodera trifolii TaxID=157864 RepID=A0ABD2LT79_9BILA
MSDIIFINNEAPVAPAAPASVAPAPSVPAAPARLQAPVISASSTCTAGTTADDGRRPGRAPAAANNIGSAGNNIACVARAAPFQHDMELVHGTAAGDAGILATPLAQRAARPQHTTSWQHIATACTFHLARCDPCACGWEDASCAAIPWPHALDPGGVGAAATPGRRDRGLRVVAVWLAQSSSHPEGGTGRQQAAVHNQVRYMYRGNENGRV